MRDVHLRNLDLNLIHPLHALLEECHVTRAAKRSFLSQSAMSRALERLRDMFGEQLLVRHGRGYERTVACTLPFFVPAIFAIAQTDLILTVPRKLARITAAMAAVRVVEAPREIGSFPYFMAWHPRLTNEPAHKWFREQLRSAVRMK